MASNFCKCDSCGKNVHFEKVSRCPRCNRTVCKWCLHDDKICDDCFFSELQNDVAKEQFHAEMTKLRFDRYIDVSEKKKR